MPRILLIFLLSFFTIKSYTQVQIENINDAQAFLQEYLSPLGNGLGAITNNGWYNSARPHRLLGFDATFTLSLLNISEEHKIFDPNSIVNFSSSETSTPTIIGVGDGALVQYNGEEFKLPNQTKLFPTLALPNFNFGLGVLKKTEINGRFIPNYKYNLGFFGKGEIGMWGVGFKHDVLQWLPIVDKIPIDISIQAGYTKLTSTFELNDPTNSINPTKANMDVTATTFNIVFSKKILMFTPYASIGYNSTKTIFNVNGEYEIAGYNIGAKDLTSIEFENNNNLRANVGFRFQIAILALQANYTFSDYPIATLGVGISVR